MCNVYCDGVFDLLHIGHIRHFRKIHEEARLFFGNDVKLIVGIIGDDNCLSYKRKPIYDELERCEIVEALKYVSKVINNVPLIITSDFIKKHEIKRVYHAYSDKSDMDKQSEFFRIPIMMDIFCEIDYDDSRTTTKTIEQLNRLYKNG